MRISPVAQKRKTIQLVLFLSALHLMAWCGSYYAGLFAANHTGDWPGLRVIIFMLPCFLLSGPFIFMSLGVVYFVSWEIADLPPTLANSLLYGIAGAVCLQLSWNARASIDGARHGT